MKILTLISKISPDKIALRGEYKVGDKIKKIQKMIDSLDKRVISLIGIGNNIAYVVCLIGVISLYIEYKQNISIEFFYIGISIFKLGIILLCGFIFIGGGLGIVKKFMEEK